ncbi:MAG TPA: DUF481 domain-containing protein [Sulfurimonas sp.]|nr:DUF481 domain-containing protein [Sulfurimonas sp.]
MRFFLLNFLLFIKLFAIVDNAPVDFKEREEGFSGSLFGAYELKRGNTDKNELDFGGRIQYDTDETITWVQGEMEKDKVRSVDTDDNAFFHLRHLRLLHSSWAGELFTQYKTDKFKNLSDRVLLGAGLRYKLLDSGNYNKIFIGFGLYDEEVRYTEDTDTGVKNPDENNIRINSYLSYKTKINDNVELSLLSYLQPRLEDTADCMAAATAELIIHLTKVFDLSYKIEYDYDTRPPTDVKKEDIDQRLSFIYRFGKDDPFTSYAHTFLKSTSSLDDVNTSSIIAVEIETDIEDIKDFRDVFAGKWSFGKEVFHIDFNGTGIYTYDKSIYTQKLTWKIISTATQDGEQRAKEQSTKLIIISFEDEEGRLERVDNYLWSENTLIGLSGATIRLFKRF